MSACPSENDLTALVEGALAPASVSSIEDHLGDCAACAELVAEIARLVAPAGGDDDAGRFGGRYEVVRLLGRGGMGAVYEARDVELERSVALKVIRPDVGGAAEREHLEKRLVREARALAHLTHPNIVTVYDVGRGARGVFIAFELVRGRTAEDVGVLRGTPWREVLGLYLQAAGGLAAAHRAGIVHRDVKPSNLLVGDDGRVRVTDFGLAKDAPDRPADLETPLTFAGDVVGTPAYMAPEQHGAGVDEKADQFSFCVALYEALYGERPFEGKTAREILAAAREGKVRPAPAGSSVPRRVRAALVRGLSPLPHQRYASMSELADELERAASWRSAGWIVRGVLAAAAAAGAAALVASSSSGPSSEASASAAVAASSAPALDGIEASSGAAPASAPPAVAEAPAETPAIQAPPPARPAAPAAGDASMVRLYNEAANALVAGDGKRCLALLDRADAMPFTLKPPSREHDDRAGSPLLRAQCIMLLGRCEEGVARLRAAGWRDDGIELMKQRHCRK